MSYKLERELQTISSVQFSSVAQSCPALFNPMDMPSFKDLMVREGRCEQIIRMKLDMCPKRQMTINMETQKRDMNFTWEEGQRSGN